MESKVLKTWMSSGLWANKIVGYAPVNVHSLDSLKQAIAYFGGVYVGIQVPSNAQDQFRAGLPWTLVPGWQHQQIEGGHAVPLLGYDDQYLYAITWGAVQPMAWDWWSTYSDEAWVGALRGVQQAGHPSTGSTSPRSRPTSRRPERSAGGGLAPRARRGTAGPASARRRRGSTLVRGFQAPS